MQKNKPLISVRNLKQYFPVKGKKDLFVKANDGISLDIFEGETLGIVGESGCGKSTLGRVLLQLYKQTDGETIYYGHTLDSVAPWYAYDIYKNLENKCKEAKTFIEKAEKLETEYASLEKSLQGKDDESSRSTLFAKMNEKNEARRVADSEYLAIVRLVGGFYAANDYSEASKVLVEYYDSTLNIKNVNLKIADVVMQLEDAKFYNEKGKDKSGKISSLEAELKSLNAQIDSLEVVRKEKEAKVEAVRAKYAGNEEFRHYEAMRDDGINLARLKYNEMRHLRRDIQLIFQDPYSSLNPRLTVGQIIAEGPITHKFFKTNDERMQEYSMNLMEDCGLASYMIHRYPHQFSGGQRQRIGIARALSVKPKFVVCDEAVSALDVSIQSQIINLLQELKEKENLTYMFISHDLSVVKYISDRIAVMYLGNIVELASSAKMFEKPLHPYTEALLSAIPTTDNETKKDMIMIEGDIPSPINPPKGCKFNTRCNYVMDICTQVVPDFAEIEPDHFVACHKYNEAGRAGESTELSADS